MPPKNTTSASLLFDQRKIFFYKETVCCSNVVFKTIQYTVYILVRYGDFLDVILVRNDFFRICVIRAMINQASLGEEDWQQSM